MTTQATAVATTAIKENRQRTTMTLTPSAVAGLDKLAGFFNLSRSAFVEKIGKGEIPLLIASPTLLTPELTDKIAS